MKGFETHGVPQAPKVKSPEELLREEHQEKIELTWNALQFYVAQKSTASGEEALHKVLSASGAEFREWFESSQGALQIDKHAREHTLEEIEAFADIDKLVDEFTGYLSRKPKTLH